MFGYILRRVLATIPVVVIVAVFVFLLLRLTPGDAAAIIAGDSATPAQIENIRKSLGLTEPLTVQFRTWMTQLASGDLGTSIISRQPVTKLIGQRVGPTLQIATLTIILSVLIAVPLGVLAAWRHRSWLDYAVMAFSVIGFSIPAFVVGYILMKIFAVDLRWLPVQGFTSVFQDPQQFLRTAVLPCMTLATVFVALIARMTRASMLDVLGEDYIRTARAKGVKERIVLFRHALGNAAVPIVTIIGTGFALLIAGVVVTESVYNIPGIGRLTVDAVLARDYPVIQAMILLTSALYVFINLLIDLSYTIFDPRIRY
ncbi:ABC transporter permease [Bordetella bronchiseptica]|uniref:ABC transporter, permease protein n=4 Tax=Bordetella bronchiseptica TaxID=518 RepID=A0ABR4RA66_BORBO|nr:ABC transporter permease [Bordetella bronchiseptica]KAK62858.1 ABC transporter, permease protein [Bordetella bronchiseptica 980-2]KCV32074.1 ABC transporter, permease protein [Bordetella bronchiseptica 00-P-2730]KDD50130.1 ABC transporter, permease protein [Bordetella bronchiseptica OSU553]SHQ89671.1 binding-protein-dependent transport systems inner membrane component [Mycobacteroides abscessus subsp. abscessus]AMG90129.1 ABC transporter permease [Bordetella bronchiseptica]